MPPAPYSLHATLAFAAVALMLPAFDYPVGTWSVASISLIVPALAVDDVWSATGERNRP